MCYFILIWFILHCLGTWFSKISWCWQMHWIAKIIILSLHCKIKKEVVLLSLAPSLQEHRSSISVTSCTSGLRSGSYLLCFAHFCLNKYEESEHMEWMKMDKKVDWKKTNSKSITVDRSLCHSRGLATSAIWGWSWVVGRGGAWKGYSKWLWLEYLNFSKEKEKFLSEEPFLEAV